MHFFFAYYPYICITLLLAGLAFRYVTDPGDWNARSSEIFEKTWLRRGSIIFHYAIILSFFGHIVGLLTPDSVMHALRISMEAHTVVAVGMGMILAPLVVVGLGILLWRRITNEHVWATTVPMDVLVVLLILINGCTGFYQAYVAHFPVFVTVGPWLRSLVVFRPDVVLMETVPLFFPPISYGNFARSTLDSVTPCTAGFSFSKYPRVAFIHKFSFANIFYVIPPIRKAVSKR